jgi:O-antigen/teichoic acid export membrane protein
MSNSPFSGDEVKRSAGHFLIGKAVSALLTFTILLWLVRLLSVPEYAAYITLVAALEITIVVASVGLPWIEARYLPEFRLHAAKATLIRFVVRLIEYQLGVFVLTAILAWFSLNWLLAKTEMTGYVSVAQLYVFMLVIEGGGRRLRDGVLSMLLQQKLAQTSLVIRNVLFIIAVAIMAYYDEITLTHVVAAELIASLVGLFYSLIGLWLYLQHIELTQKDDWQQPSWSQMWVVARNMYFSEIVTQAYSSQVFTLIVRHSLGAEATAVFGFLRNLYMQVRNYLPASLLFGLIRPKLVASYVGDGGIAELTRNANLVGKLSLFILMPLIVFSLLTGEELILLLSGGKFSHTGYYFAGLMFSLIPVSQRQILETVALVTENSQLCNLAASLGVLTLPVTYLLIKMDFGLWSPIFATLLGNVLFCSTIVKGVTKNTHYHADYLGYNKMLFATFVAYLGGIEILWDAHGWSWFIEMGLLSCVVFLVAAAVIQPFSESERLRINRLIKRNLFIW